MAAPSALRPSSWNLTATTLVVSLVATLLLVGCAAPADLLPERCDLLIAGGTVVDGSGAPARQADVLVVGDRIAAVRRLTAAERTALQAETTVDATGKVVTPGFIDIHAHGDPLRTPDFANFVAMGVTTICLGLDGSSPSLAGAKRGDLGAWLDAVDDRHTAVHVAAFVGHGSLRAAIAPDATRPLDATERNALADRVAAALEAGAFGLSTGLEYTPGRYADAAELAAAATPLAARGGLIASHVRNEDSGAVQDAVAELIEQARASGARAHLSHAKIVHGRDPAEASRLLAQLEQARAAGTPATADLYPYTASFTGLSILFPEWALAPHDYAAAMADRRAELAEHLRRRVQARGGPDATLIGTGEFAGRTLTEAAADREQPFEDLLIDLGPRGGSAAYFVMDQAVMEHLLQDPLVMIASDGSPTMRHPRGHGSFARVIREFVVERGLLSLEEAVRKMTSLPADTLGLADRGRVAPGQVADLLVFDPAQVRDRATFTRPFDRASGFEQVLVSGRLVIRDGEATGARPAGSLRADPTAVSGSITGAR